ncbi:hypothetical protein GOP47_0002299 [Adiantum capillus-veneris]|uniref:Pentatricopeptide repeat-containing protein n=1 Tax=Adiantum capillus-veneris TaxID=13818 RepID=A0A9D4ZQV1_ADICA|nr:hypothetical protein GOP47_0002299 [Adiantum capillus-veneris]
MACLNSARTVKTSQALELYNWEASSLENAIVGLEQLTEGASIGSIVCVLQKCRKEKNLDCARRAHLHIREHGLEENTVIGNYLVPTLADCGGLSEAQQVFESLKYKNEHSWTFLIQGYVESGDFAHALNLYQSMKEQNVSPNRYTLQLILKACAKLQRVEKGHETHAEVIKNTYEGNQFVASTLVDMYVKCGLLAEAQDVFDELVVQDIVSWTALIAGYAEHGPHAKALDCVERMQAKGIYPDAFTFVCTLKACTSLGAMSKGQEIHQEIVRVGLEGEPFVGSALVDMYAKCASVMEAERVFDRLLVRDVVLWNVIIAAYAEQGERDKASHCLRIMRQQDVSPNALTFIALLQGYDGSGLMDEMQDIHIEVTKEGLERDPLVGSALVGIYARSGALIDALKIFDKLCSRNVVSWTALISGYADHCFGAEALNCLKEMQADGVAPNDVTFVCGLKACGQIGALDRGRELHSMIAIEGFERDTFVGNTLVDVYARCGMLLEARDVFDELQVQDVVSWNALSSRYLEHGFDEEALSCLEQMKGMSISPDLLTYVRCLKACGCLGVVEKGQELHADVSIEAFEEDPFVRSTVVDMYSKCGLLLEAHDVFDDLPVKDVVVWNALLAGYAFKGESACVFDLVEKMKGQDVEPNEVTYLSILTACSHEGLVVKGLIDFQALARQHVGLVTIHHYNCIVDLLGRAGCLDEAVAILKKFPCQPNLVTWSTLLGACRKWGDIELARQAFESAHIADEKHAAVFIAMARIYASANMWEDAKLVQGTQHASKGLRPQKMEDVCKRWDIHDEAE